MLKRSCFFFKHIWLPTNPAHFYAYSIYLTNIFWLIYIIASRKSRVERNTCIFTKNLVHNGQQGLMVIWESNPLLTFCNVLFFLKYFTSINSVQIYTLHLCNFQVHESSRWRAMLDSCLCASTYLLHEISDCITKLILQHNEDFLSGPINFLLLHHKLPQTQQLKQYRFLSHSFRGQQSGFDLTGSFS